MYAYITLAFTNGTESNHLSKICVFMEQELITNPFKIEHYDYGWSDIRDMINTMVNRYPQRYRLAYHNDYYQKVIILINLHPTFNIEHANLIYISKIDAEPSSSFLIYEAKKYDGDITTPRDFKKGDSCMKEFSKDLFLVNHIN